MYHRGCPRRRESLYREATTTMEREINKKTPASILWKRSWP